MNIDPDYFIERKKTKKQLIKWKLFSLLLIIIALLTIDRRVIEFSKFFNGNLIQQPHIASIKIEEVILDDLDRAKNLESIAENENIKAVILHVNSPGGSVVGSEILYNALQKIAKAKPVVVVMGSLAASGGYLIALGGDYIVAHNGTLTGSIGVIMQSAEITELAEKLGVKFENFKSDILKAAPNPTEKVTPEVREATMDTIYHVYDYFIEQVSIKRKLNIDYVRKIADGRIYSGRQALELKLVDAVGNQDTALEWLYTKKNIAKELEIIDTKIKPQDRLMDFFIEDIKGAISSFFYSGVKLLM